jgi:hypothetical protein
MVMRYHWGLGIGHTYAHDSRVSLHGPQAQDNIPHHDSDSLGSFNQPQAQNHTSELENITGTFFTVCILLPVTYLMNQRLRTVTLRLTLALMQNTVWTIERMRTWGHLAMAIMAMAIIVKNRMMRHFSLSTTCTMKPLEWIDLDQF